MKNIAILISGRGSNMEAIVRTCAEERWDARIAAVVSNRADAAGLAFARGHGIATAVADHRAFATRDAFDAALAEQIEQHAADVVALAGFMRILSAEFVQLISASSGFSASSRIISTSNQLLQELLSAAR